MCIVWDFSRLIYVRQLQPTGTGPISAIAINDITVRSAHSPFDGEGATHSRPFVCVCMCVCMSVW